MVDIEKCKSIVSGLDFDSSYEDLWLDQLRSLNSEEEITDEEYDYILDHIDELAEEEE